MTSNFDKHIFIDKKAWTATALTVAQTFFKLNLQGLKVKTDLIRSNLKNSKIGIKPNIISYQHHHKKSICCFGRIF